MPNRVIPDPAHHCVKVQCPECHSTRRPEYDVKAAEYFCPKCLARVAAPVYPVIERGDCDGSEDRASS